MSGSLRALDFEELFFRYRYPISFLLTGIILLGLGVFYAKTGGFSSSTVVEVLESTSSAKENELKLVVEVSGAVENPGVYYFDPNSRIEDALISAGGASADADRVWMEKTLNRASKLTDGQKIYIPRQGENSNVKGQKSKVNNLININNATLNELDSLWGIGPVTGQNIIDQRPYSIVDELLTRGILKKNVYERNKDKLSVY